MPEEPISWEDVDAARRSGDFEVGWARVFCGQPVSEDEADFCRLNVEGEWGFTSFTAHVPCFRNASADPEHFPTLGPAERPPDYVPPPQDLVGAWEKLWEVLADIQFADIGDAEQVRAVTRSIREAAEANGVPFQDR